MAVREPEGRHEAHVRSSQHLVTFELDAEGKLVSAHGPDCSAWGLTPDVMGIKLLDLDVPWTASLTDLLPRVSNGDGRCATVSWPARNASLELIPAPWRGSVFGHLRRAGVAGNESSVTRLTDLGRWTRSAIHMLNNSLVGILGYAALGRQTDAASSQDRAFDQITRSGTTLRSRVQILLEYGRTVTSPNPQSEGGLASKAIDMAVQLLSLQAPQVVQVARTIPPDTPPIAAPSSAVGAILANLLENAYDAVSGDVDRFEVAVTHTSTTVSVTVQDDGPGMDETLLTRIFTPFMTTKSGVDNVLGGDGLGLTLAQSMAEELGGRLEVSSRVGEGTRATLICPVHEPGASASDHGAQGVA